MSKIPIYRSGEDTGSNARAKAPDGLVRALAPPLIAGAGLSLALMVLHPVRPSPGNPFEAVAAAAAKAGLPSSPLSLFFAVVIACVALVAVVAVRSRAARAVQIAHGALNTALIALAAAIAVRGMQLFVLKRPATGDAAGQLLADQAVLALDAIKAGLLGAIGLLFALAMALFAVSLWRATRAPRWLALAGLALAAIFAVTSLTGLQGGSAAAEMLAAPAYLIVAAWMTVTGVCMWRLARPDADAPAQP